MMGFPEQWKLVDEILDAIGFSRESPERRRMRNFTMHVGVDSRPVISIEYVPDERASGIITRHFNLKAEPIPQDVTTRSDEYAKISP